MSIGKIECAETHGTSGLVITWDDGRRAELDLEPIIAGRKALAPIGDSATFQRMRLSRDGWSIEWPDCGIDLGASQLRRWSGLRDV